MIVARAVEQLIDRHPCTTESCGFRTPSPAAADEVAAQTLARVACSLQQNHEHFSVLPFVGQGGDVTSSGVRAAHPTMHLRKALQGLAASGHPFRVSLSATPQAALRLPQMLPRWPKKKIHEEGEGHVLLQSSRPAKPLELFPV
jgi:hypothetical protein